MISKIVKFIQDDIWRIRLKNLTPARSAGINALRILIAAVRSFDEHRCSLRASALTFYSLLSVVPVAAMAFGIAKGFSYEKILQEKLLDKFEGQEDILLKIFAFADSMLENTKGGLIAGIGVAVLFWTIIKMLGNIEDSFNDIWGVKKPRSIARKATDYLSVMLIAPVLLVLSGSATVMITTQVEFIASKLELMGALRPLIALFLKLSPYVIIWVLFCFIYLFMPNTKVSISSGMIAGIIAGSAYQSIQWFYVKFQVGVAQYNAIYGSFAALPLFLVWLQLSWLIVLAGAEISYAHQNSEMLEYEPQIRRISHSYRRLLNVRVAHLICRNFSAGAPPLTGDEIVRATDIPKGMVRRILDDLSEGGIIIRTAGESNQGSGYQPAVDTALLSIKYVMDAMDKKGYDDLPVAQTPEFEALRNGINTFGQLVDNSPANMLLKDL